MIPVYHIGNELYYVKQMAKARYILGTDEEGLPTVINIDTGKVMSANIIECVRIITAGTQEPDMG